MKRKFTLQIILILIATSNCLITSGQDKKEFTPNGKPFALIYTDVASTLNKDGNSKSFNIKRAYLGYEYFFSDKLSSKVNLDVADPGVGKLQMTAYVKNAYLMYKTKNFSARFGMIGVNQFNIQEKQWGYRYIYKSFQDEYNFSPSADIGAAIEYSPASFISLDFSILNGEGYKKLQSDSTFKETFGITLSPVKGLVIRGYYDLINHTYRQTSMALYAGYSFKNFKSGIEYNIQKNNGMVNNHDLYGVSFYTSLVVAKKYSVFASYDNLWSDTIEGETDPWNNNKDGQLFMAGFDYSPTRGIKLAPTFSGWSPADKTMPFTSTIALNFEIKF